jgi:hypothetical protein
LANSIPNSIRKCFFPGVFGSVSGRSAVAHPGDSRGCNYAQYDVASDRGILDSSLGGGHQACEGSSLSQQRCCTWLQQASHNIHMPPPSGWTSAGVLSHPPGQPVLAAIQQPPPLASQDGRPSVILKVGNTGHRKGIILRDPGFRVLNLQKGPDVWERVRIPLDFDRWTEIEKRNYLYFISQISDKKKLCLLPVGTRLATSGGKSGWLSILKSNAGFWKMMTKRGIAGSQRMQRKEK